MSAFEAFCASPERDATCDGPREFPGAAALAPALAASDALFRASLGRHDRSYRDPRVGPAFVMNPALGGAFTRDGLARVEVPVHIVACVADTIVPAGTNACRFAERIPGARLSLVESEADHYVFLCEATDAGRRIEPQTCVDAAGVDRRDVHDRTAEMAARFFGVRQDAPAGGERDAEKARGMR